MKVFHIKRVITTQILIIVFLLTGACGSLSGNSGTESGDATPTVITDREGKPLTIHGSIDKIISVSPSVTETLVHLGLADKLIAIDQYSTAISGLPENLPAFDIMTPDIERIAALQPDIVFAPGMSKAGGDDPFNSISDLGIVMTYIPPSTNLAGIKADIRFIGQVTGTTGRAEAIVGEMEAEIDEILARIGTPAQPKAVYFEIYDLYSFGNGTFLNEMIEMLGARNILADQEGWLSVSEEAVIAENPDIIFTSVDYIDDPVSAVLGRQGWEAITAVKDKNVWRVDANASSRPNEYITVALKQMAEALYPTFY